MLHEPEVKSWTGHVKNQAEDGTWSEVFSTIHQAWCGQCGWCGPRRTRSHDADDDVYQHRMHEND